MTSMIRHNYKDGHQISMYSICVHGKISVSSVMRQWALKYVTGQCNTSIHNDVTGGVTLIRLGLVQQSARPMRKSRENKWGALQHNLCNRSVSGVNVSALCSMTSVFGVV